MVLLLGYFRVPIFPHNKKNEVFVNAFINFLEYGLFCLLFLSTKVLVVRMSLQVRDVIHEMKIQIVSQKSVCIGFAVISHNPLIRKMKQMPLWFSGNEG